MKARTAPLPAVAAAVTSARSASRRGVGNTHCSKGLHEAIEVRSRTQVRPAVSGRIGMGQEKLVPRIGPVAVITAFPPGDRAHNARRGRGGDASDAQLPGKSLEGLSFLRPRPSALLAKLLQQAGRWLSRLLHERQLHDQQKASWSRGTISRGLAEAAAY